MFVPIFTKTMNKGFSKNLSSCVIILSASLLTACADKKETKNSSDFATSAIEANYSVKVSEAHKVVYQANFTHDKNSLKLEGGDAITITSIGAEKIALTESISGGVATYSLNRTEGSDPVRPFFDFARSSQKSATGSFVLVPNSFTLVSPTSASKSYEPADRKTFNVTWDHGNAGDSLKETFTLRYDFECRHSSGAPSISGHYSEKVTEDGAHTVNLPVVLAENGKVDDYTACRKFDITATRSTGNGNLVTELKSGSVVGSQVRIIKGSLDRLELL